jgi:hypothetical protein
MRSAETLYQQCEGKSFEIAFDSSKLLPYLRLRGTVRGHFFGLARGPEVDKEKAVIKAFPDCKPSTACFV